MKKLSCFPMRFIIVPILIFCFLSELAHSSDQTKSNLESGTSDLNEKQKKADSDRWGYILSGWKAEREKVRSGIVTIEGEDIKTIDADSTSNSDQAKIQTSKFKIKIFFDSVAGCQKCIATNYRTEQGRTCVCIVTPDGISTWTSDNKTPDAPHSHINVWNRSADLPSYAIYWNPLCAGFSKISTGGKVPLDPINDWYKRFISLGDINSTGVIEFANEENKQLTKIQTRSDNLVNDRPCFVNHDMVFNESKGFGLISHKFWVYPKEFEKPEVPFSEVNIDWKNISSVWVPTSISTVRSGGKRKRILNLTWEAINTPINKDEFKTDKIDAPAGTYIVDMRLGKDSSYVDNFIGGNSSPTQINSNSIGNHEEKPDELIQPATKWTIVWMNVIAVLLIIIALIWKAKHSN